MKIEATHTTWMGEVPEHWEVKALKFCADLITKRVDGSEVQGEYVGLEHIESKTGKFVRLEGSQESAESTVSCYCNGDVLFGKLRPYLAKAAVAESEGVCSSEILVYRPHAMDPHYLKHVMLLEGFIEEVNASTCGSKMPRADSAFISRLPVPVPPMQEQIEIAKYLDVETNRIDELIEAKRDLLGILNSFSATIFFSELAKRADTLAGRHDPVLHWLANLPSEWGRCKVKHLVQKFDQGVSPQCENRVPAEDEWGVLKVGCVNSGVFDPMESKALPLEIDPVPDVTVKSGDLLISRANTSDFKVEKKMNEIIGL